MGDSLVFPGNPGRSPGFRLDRPGQKDRLLGNSLRNSMSLRLRKRSGYEGRECQIIFVPDLRAAALKRAGRSNSIWPNNMDQFVRQ